VITVDEALAKIAENAAPRATERVPLSEAFGRVLAREIRSDVDWPPFHTSAMDGYAVRLADVPAAGGEVPERSQTVAAGDAPPRPIAAGETVRVMTGAPLPEGTEAVVPVERARREAGLVRFEAVPAAGDHIRRRGESVAAGSPLVEAGRRLGSGQIALAALAGADPIVVFRRPRIRIVTTGNELVPADRTPAPGQLRDSNGPALRALCAAHGWPASLWPAVADDKTSVEGLFASAEELDLLLTCGGVSAGDLDLLPSIAERSGFTILFAKVAMRPGKPVVFGRRGGLLWLGLPGNPVSASVGFHLLAREALSRLEGDARPGAPRITARLASDLPPAGRRETYRDALWQIDNGVSVVAALASAGSHDVAAHARANALIRSPAESPPARVGELVECVLLDGSR
jgi:molybdopterin molybdotransferase